MSPDSITTAGAIIAGLAVIEVVRAAAGKFVSTDYVTRKDCEKCRRDCRENNRIELERVRSERNSDLDDMKNDIRVIKRLLLVLAHKVGVDEKYLQGLVE